MSKDAHAVIAHCRAHLGRLDPLADLAPGKLIVEVAGYQMIRYSRAVEDAGDLRGRACLAVFQPDARHRSPIAQGVELLVIQLRHGLKVQHDDRNARLLHDRQHGGRKGVGRQVQEDHVHALATEPIGRLAGLVRVIDESRVDDFSFQIAKPRGDLGLITGQALAQALELRPIRVQSNAE